MHTIITGLIYPAFLGALIYEAVEKIADFKMYQGTIAPLLCQGILMLLLSLHYVCDFYYTTGDKVSAVYSKVRMASDLGIILCMYIALKTAMSQSVSSVSAKICLLLFLTKLCACLWEITGIQEKSIWERKMRDLNSETQLGLKLDMSFFVLYLASAIFLVLTPKYYWTLFLLIAADISCYIFFDRLHGVYKKIKDA